LSALLGRKKQLLNATRVDGITWHHFRTTISKQMPGESLEFAMTADFHALFKLLVVNYPAYSELLTALFIYF
jgi:hypothetical protein